jgi:hypothetical protein
MGVQRSGRGWITAVAFTLLATPPARAERLVQPFVGITFGGETTYITLDQGAGRPSGVFGASGVFLGNVVGLEVDVAHAPRFFRPTNLVPSALVTGARSVTTVTGNVIVAAPKRLIGYSLRPYAVAGGGLMRVRLVDWIEVFEVNDSLAAFDVGGGATGFLTDRVGLNWDVRHFQSMGDPIGGKGVSIGQARLSFWRASMAIAIRY